MKFIELAKYFQKLENITSRNEMVLILADLFRKSDKNEIDKICYLTQGRVAPLYEAIEFGMAEKMVIRAIAIGYEISIEKVTTLFKTLGDLGAVAEKLRIMNKELRIKNKEVCDVFEVLKNIAEAGGSGSVDVKTNLLASLLKELDSLSNRYIVRIPVAKMRLGFSDMTVLDSLSWMTGKSKEHRKEIERAFNVRPDLGFIAKTIKEEGIGGLLRVNPKVGTPILMARAERLSSGKEIIDKIGPSAIEPKIDGFRLQCHFLRKGFRKTAIKNSAQSSFDFVPDGNGIQKVRLFTRNLEDVTFMYPDITSGIEKQISGDEVIFEGEAIAYNLNNGEYLPFQETVQRKRKYDIEKMKKEVPLRLICFDILYKDGKNYLNEPYKIRREKLEKSINKGETVLISEEQVISNPTVLEQVFQDAVARGLEGVMAKRLDGVYQAGARGWNWIKYKRSYDAKLDDTIDALVMGYDFGQGKRTGFGIGAFLIGIYDKESDSFKTIAKIGTGLTDEEWKALKVKSHKLKVKSKPARYDVDKMMECDVWVEPFTIVVIKADEITRSPVHTAGREMQKTKGGGGMEVKTPGFALRFPRLVDFRDDKSSEDATSLVEIEEMYNLQSKKQ